MLRIQVSTSSTGIVDSNHFYYEFIVNPSEVNLQGSSDISIIDTLDGSPVIQESIWDGRVRELIWNGYGATSTVLPSISVQVGTMKSWVGKQKYFNFRDLNSINLNWPVSNVFKKCRVVNLKTKLKNGGPLRYESVILEIVPEM